MNNKYEIDFCNGSISKKLMQFTIPLIFTGFLQLLYNAADIIIVGQFGGKTSLAAVGSTTSLVHLITNISLGISCGACAGVAVAKGANDEKRMSRMISTSMALSIICGLISMIIGLIASKQMLRLMGTPNDVITKSDIYLKIIFFGMIPTMVYNFGASALRAIGDTKRPLVFLAISGAVNVVLNLITVILFKLDVVGVAISTITSQFVSAFLVVLCLIKMPGAARLDLSAMKIFNRELKYIIKIGLPAGIQGSLFSVSNIIIQSSVNSFGSTVIAANSASANIEGFIYIISSSFNQGAMTLISQNMGAKNLKRIINGSIKSLTLVTVIIAIFSSIVLLTAKYILHIYSSDPNVIKYGILRLNVTVIWYITCGTMDTMAGILRGTGNSLQPMFVSIFGVCIFRIMWIFTVFAKYHSLFALYISYPLSWILTTICEVICYLYILRKTLKPTFGKISC